MTNYSRSVLKSNGLRHSKILPVKFGFSLKTVHANIAKKSLPQCCSKPLFIAFSTSRTTGPHSLSRMKSGTHATPAPNRAHSGLHAETGAFRTEGAITTLGAFRTFTNIPGPGIRTANFAAFGSWSGVLPKNAESQRNSDALMRVAVPRRRGPAGLRDPIAVSLAALIDFAVLVVYDNSTRKHICRFHTLVCFMRLATRCRSVALSTASICR